MQKKHIGSQISFQPRIRRGAFFEAAWDHGCRNFSVYNRTYISGNFTNSLDEYWQVNKHVAVWPVMGERQIEITGTDAQDFIQYLTSRNMKECKVGQCKYALFLNSDGGIICDPIVLRLEDDKYWVSTSDCDLELWIKGIQVNSGYKVTVKDANVSLLQVQGPKSSALMAKLFGDHLLDLKYYWTSSVNLNGLDLLVSRTGWSGELGYEIYLSNQSEGTFLFNEILKQGEEFSVAPGSVNQARRIESGILSWGADISQDENPFEVGLQRLVELNNDDDFVGKNAVINLGKQKQSRGFIGLKLFSDDPTSNETPWKIFYNGRVVGKMTSMAYSPRCRSNIGIGLVESEYCKSGLALQVEGYGSTHYGEVVPLPFFKKNQMMDARKLKEKYTKKNNRKGT